MAGSVNKDVKPCARCGARFIRPAKYSHAQWETKRFCSHRCAGMKRKVSDHEIRTLYAAGKSSTEVAALTGISAAHVLRIVRAYGETRSAIEAHALAASKPEFKAKISRAHKGRSCPEHVKEILRGIVGPQHHSWGGGIQISLGGYLCFTSSPANGVHAGRAIHTVIAEWKIGRPIKEGEHVHHIDRNKLNNHPDNLEVLTASDHARLHFEDREKGKANVRIA